MLPELSPQHQLPEKTGDQKKAEKLDKFRDHLLHQTHLTPKEELMLEKYRKCFAWRCKLFSPQQCVAMLMQEYDIKYSQAYQIMHESTKLYGKVEDIDKAGTTKILIETLYVAMSLAVKDKNPDAIIAATREIAKLTKLHVEEIPLTVDDLMPARTVKYVQNNITISSVTNQGPESPTNG